jgi:hypothetical protein
MSALPNRAPLSREEAEALTEEIAGILSDGFERVAPLVVTAYQRRAWLSVGYESWDDYCRGEFRGPRMLRFTDDQLTEIIRELSDAGMSVRGMASAVGVSVGKVHRVRPERRPDNVISLDGKRRGSSGPARDRSMASHPAGKAKPVDVAGLAVAESIYVLISLSAGEGMTYREIDSVTNFRESQVTGALSGLKRTGRIVAGWIREGHVAWVAAGTDVLAE